MTLDELHRRFFSDIKREHFDLIIRDLADMDIIPPGEDIAASHVLEYLKYNLIPTGDEITKDDPRYPQWLT